MRSGAAGATVRETYLLLLQHCANHSRSVFAETTRNRLTLADGVFTTSTHDGAVAALAPFDASFAHKTTQRKERKLLDVVQSRVLAMLFSGPAAEAASTHALLAEIATRLAFNRNGLRFAFVGYPCVTPKGRPGDRVRFHHPADLDGHA